MVWLGPCRCHSLITSLSTTEIVPSPDGLRPLPIERLPVPDSVSIVPCRLPTRLIQINRRLRLGTRETFFTPPQDPRTRDKSAAAPRPRLNAGGGTSILGSCIPTESADRILMADQHSLDPSVRD